MDAVRIEKYVGSERYALVRENGNALRLDTGVIVHFPTEVDAKYFANRHGYGIVSKPKCRLCQHGSAYTVVCALASSEHDGGYLNAQGKPRSENEPAALFVDDSKTQARKFAEEHGYEVVR